MPYNGTRTHAGQAAASRRKRRNRQARRAVLLQEAKALRISVEALLKRKFQEWQRVGEDVAGQIIAAREAARLEYESRYLRY
jgi:hypothetical protein